MSNQVSTHLISKPVVGVPIPRDYFQREPLWGNAGGYRAVNEIIEAVTAAGGVARLLFPGDSDRNIDALLLPGGGDVDPSFYGQAAQSEVTDTDPELDAYQLDLAQAALRRGTPVLGICRGMQVLNVAAGGSLVQHLEASDRHFPEGARRNPDLRSQPVHPISIESDSHLAELLGETLLDVNSLHHQAVDVLGPGLRAVAHSSDGIVEALEGNSGFQMGVQFHPEDLRHGDERFQSLFTRLVEAARTSQS